MLASITNGGEETKAFKVFISPHTNALDNTQDFHTFKYSYTQTSFQVFGLFQNLFFSELLEWSVVWDRMHVFMIFFTVSKIEDFMLFQDIKNERNT